MIDSIVALDQSVLESLYAIRDLNASYVFIWISELGRVPTIYGLAFAIALVLILKQRYAYAVSLIITVALSGLGIIIGKGLVERARPDIAYQAYVETWYSFPSAHAALATTLYGFLAYLALHTFSSLKRNVVILFCVLAIVGISFSRLYLGVHFLSDVVAGVMLGAVCVWFGVMILKRLQR